MKLEVVVLAAGKGTRMYSDIPKVLHPVGGRPMLGHVIDTARSLEPARIHVVVGYQAEQIREAFADDPDLNWVEQASQLGTGHAVQQAMPDIDDDSGVLVLYGDVPLVGQGTVKALVSRLDQASLAVLTLHTEQPRGLGRIIRDEEGRIAAIVEEKDASEEQRRIGEVNSGIIAARGERLRQWLNALDNDNAQGEYYLTDTVAMSRAEGEEVGALSTRDETEVQGINNRLQLALLERHWQRSMAEQLMLQGVTLSDPARLDVRGRFLPGRDNCVDVNVVIEGHVTTGDRVSIGPNVFLKDCEIDDDVTIQAHSHLEGARIRSGCTVGPFSRLRQGTVLDRQSRIGNFVETKNSVIGEGSKVNHLSYIGDTEMGREVNIGAGTITCNYDGANKHKTRIDEESFIGSNTAIVAPVQIGAHATVAAGSVVTDDVPEDNLAVARGRQKNIAGWKRPQPKKHQS